ncbi:MAG: type II secretion system protein [Gammaproteobacteria bacterium]
MKKYTAATLMEFVFVLAAVGVLFVFAAPLLSNLVNEVKEVHVRNNMRVIDHAMRLLGFNAGAFPTSNDEAKSLNVGGEAYSLFKYLSGERYPLNPYTIEETKVYWGEELECSDDNRGDIFIFPSTAEGYVLRACGKGGLMEYELKRGDQSES